MIYIVHDTNIDISIYIASDIIKKFSKKDGFYTKWPERPRKKQERLF